MRIEKSPKISKWSLLSQMQFKNVSSWKLFWRLFSFLEILLNCIVMMVVNEKKRPLLRLGALSLLLEIARRDFSVDAIEPTKGILLIVESLTMEANESDNINIAHNALTVSNEKADAREQVKKIFLIRLQKVKQIAETHRDGEAGFKSSPKWHSGLKLPSVLLILSMLRGLSMGHLETQKCIDEGGILSLLHVRIQYVKQTLNPYFVKQTVILIHNYASRVISVAMLKAGKCACCWLPRCVGSSSSNSVTG
nr:auxin transport protein BIG [Tanacetum cinerariifolium]